MASRVKSTTHHVSHSAVTGTWENASVSSNMLVAVRIRPPNETEWRTNFRESVKPVSDRVLCFDPSEAEEELSRSGDASSNLMPQQQRLMPKMLHRRAKDVRFTFDRVFDGNASQQEVYEGTTRMLIRGVLDGINSTVFCYGPTGAGKTHTMLGNADEPGVIVRTMEDLFELMEKEAADRIYDVKISYLEIYNETIRDLLQPGSTLELRESPCGGAVVVGLSKHTPANASAMFSMLEEGNLNRTQHPTDANAQSSRSHAVFQVFVEQRDRTGDITGTVRRAKLSLIDLAGSERAAATTNRGARMREGANINKSLLALGNCINALVDHSSNKRRHVHIPYRNSKLTRLLKDSLGGNCRTVMIANISPSYQSYEDTHNTLKYANRAKNIKTTQVRNVVSVKFHITKYKEIIAELRNEIEELKEKLKTSHETSKEETPAPRDAIISTIMDALTTAGMITDVEAASVIVNRTMGLVDDHKTCPGEPVTPKHSERPPIVSTNTVTLSKVSTDDSNGKGVTWADSAGLPMERSASYTDAINFLGMSNKESTDEVSTSYVPSLSTPARRVVINSNDSDECNTNSQPSVENRLTIAFRKAMRSKLSDVDSDAMQTSATSHSYDSTTDIEDNNELGLSNLLSVDQNNAPIYQDVHKCDTTIEPRTPSRVKDRFRGIMRSITNGLSPRRNIEALSVNRRRSSLSISIVSDTNDFEYGSSNILNTTTMNSHSLQSGSHGNGASDSSTESSFKQSRTVLPMQQHQPRQIATGQPNKRKVRSAGSGSSTTTGLPSFMRPTKSTVAKENNANNINGTFAARRIPITNKQAPSSNMTLSTSTWR